MNDTFSDDAALEAAEQSYGWLLFASIVLICVGIMRILDAIWAWRYDGVLPEEFQDAVLGNDLDTYGWLWLIVGIVLILAGLAVMQRSQWARWIGILAGAILTITAIAWMPFYPVWSLIYIFVGIFVIYGLAAHGGRLRVRRVSNRLAAARGLTVQRSRRIPPQGQSRSSRALELVPLAHMTRLAWHGIRQLNQG